MSHEPQTFDWDRYVPSRRYIYGRPEDPALQFQAWSSAAKKSVREILGSREREQAALSTIEDGLGQSWGEEARKYAGEILAEELCKARAPNILSSIMAKWSVDPHERTLWSLAFNGHAGRPGDYEDWLECAALLVEKGARINACGFGPLHAFSPLGAALLFLGPDMDREILALLDLGADWRASLPTAWVDDSCMLDLALRKGRVAPSLKMIEMGAAPAPGKSMLGSACKSGRVDLAVALLELGLDPEASSDAMADGSMASALDLAKGLHGPAWACADIAALFEAHVQAIAIGAELPSAPRARKSSL